MKQFLVTVHMLVSIHDEADEQDLRDSVTARLEDEAGYLDNGYLISPIPGSLNVASIRV